MMGLATQLVYCFKGRYFRHMKEMFILTNPLVNSISVLVPGHDAPIYTVVTDFPSNSSPDLILPPREEKEIRIELPGLC